MKLFRNLLNRQRPEESAKYGSGGLPWSSLDEETKAAARALREMIENNLTRHVEKLTSGLPSARPHLRSLRTLVDEHFPEIVAKATDCALLILVQLKEQRDLPIYEA